MIFLRFTQEGKLVSGSKAGMYLRRSQIQKDVLLKIFFHLQSNVHWENMSEF